MRLQQTKHGASPPFPSHPICVLSYCHAHNPRTHCRIATWNDENLHLHLARSGRRDQPNVAGSAKPPCCCCCCVLLCFALLLLALLSPWAMGSACNALCLLPSNTRCALTRRAPAQPSTLLSHWAGRRKYRYIVFSSLKHFGYFGRRLLPIRSQSLSPSPSLPRVIPRPGFTTRSRYRARQIMCRTSQRINSGARLFAPGTSPLFDNQWRVSRDDKFVWTSTASRDDSPSTR